MTLERKTAFGFATLFVLLVAGCTVAYRSISTASETADAVSHTHLVIEHVMLELSELTDAETGQRGFIITGDDAYLEPYLFGVAAERATMAELRALTADNLAQQRRLDEMEPLIAAKKAELRESIELRNKDLRAAVGLVQTNVGKHTMDKLRVLIGQMQREELRLLKLRTDAAASAEAVSKVLLLFGTTISLLLLGVFVLVEQERERIVRERATM